MQFESTPKQAYDYSIRLLTKRDYSIHKLTQKLILKHFEQEHINEVIDKLIEKKYIREDEYAHSRAKQLIEKGYANNYIIQKLEHEFLPVNSIDFELLREELGQSSKFQLEQLIEKKLRFKSIPTDHDEKMKLKQKLTAYLGSKGYSYDEINTQLYESFR
jgi:regulatory protein